MSTVAAESVEELGAKYVYVSRHLGARVSEKSKIANHAGWQGKVYKLEGSDEEYKNLREETGYPDEIEGLSGVNCRHRIFPFFPGVTVLPKSDFDEEESEKLYELSQKQRAKERAIRATKRKLAVAEASKDEGTVKKLRNELIERQDDIASFCEDNDLVRQYERENVYFNSTKAKTGAESNDFEPKSGTNSPVSIENGAESGIIKGERSYKRFSMNDEEAYKQWEKDYYAENIPILTKQDKAVLSEYTDGSYDAINGVERLEKGSEAYEKICRQYGVADLDKYKKTSDDISKAISKFKLDDDIVTHRYVPGVDYITSTGSTVADLENAVGKEYTDKGFTSTCVFEHLTKKFGGKTPVHIEVKIPKGTNGAYINEFSEKKNLEFEFLLNRGTKFRVLEGGERKTTVNKWMTSERKWKDVEETEKYMILEVFQ